MTPSTLPRLLVALGCVAGAGPPASGLAAQAAGTGERLPVRKLTLANGMRILILPRPGAPTVSFVVRYAAGSVDDPPGSTGLAHLLEHLLFKGTTTIGTRDHAAERRLWSAMDALEDSALAARNGPRPDTARGALLEARVRQIEDTARTFVVPNEFNRILERNGARNLNATTTPDATITFVELPANRAELWFVLESDRQRNPAFREFYTEREVVAEERRLRVETSPDGLLNEAFLHTAFTEHPYRRPVLGEAADLLRLRRSQVAAVYRRYYGARNAVVAIVGGIDPERMVRWAHQYLDPVPAGDEPPQVTVPEPEQRSERRVSVSFDAEPRVRMGWHVPGGTHEDAAALTVLVALLTGSPGARLEKALVIDEGVATFVGTSLAPGERYPRLFTVEASPRAPHTTAEVEDAVEGEIERLARTPPSVAELERVRVQLGASRVRSLRSHLGLALQLASAESLGGDWREAWRALERMRAVTPADVQRVVRAYFHRENRTVATLARPHEGGVREAP